MKLYVNEYTNLYSLTVNINIMVLFICYIYIYIYNIKRLRNLTHLEETAMGYSRILNVKVTMIKHIYLYSRIACLECWFIRTCVSEYINQ